MQIWLPLSKKSLKVYKHLLIDYEQFTKALYFIYKPLKRKKERLLDCRVLEIICAYIIRVPLLLSGHQVISVLYFCMHSHILLDRMKLQELGHCR